jgi:hypothetical protein
MINIFQISYQDSKGIKNQCSKTSLLVFLELETLLTVNMKSTHGIDFVPKMSNSVNVEDVRTF